MACGGVEVEEVVSHGCAPVTGVTGSDRGVSPCNAVILKIKDGIVTAVTGLDVIFCTCACARVRVCAYMRVYPSHPSLFLYIYDNNKKNR